jgi:hypothetical protein
MGWITTILKFLNEKLGAVTFIVGFLAIYLLPLPSQETLPW